MPVSHYSFVSETPIPLRTRASLHPIKQCKVIQRPSAIFRHGGSKSITEGRYWDSWISTSSGRGVIMPLYLSTSSSLCLYHQQIHFPVSHYCTLPGALPVEIEILLNINIYRIVLACCLFCIQSKGNMTDQRWSRDTQEEHNSCLTRLFFRQQRQMGLKRLAPNMFPTSLYLHFPAQNAQAAHYTWFTNSSRVYSFLYQAVRKKTFISCCPCQQCQGISHT